MMREKLITENILQSDDLETGKNWTVFNANFQVFPV